MTDRGLSQSDAAREIGCSQVFVSELLRGEKLPGLQTAHAIERATADWARGPIRTEEWLPKDEAA